MEVGGPNDLLAAIHNLTIHGNSGTRLSLDDQGNSGGTFAGDGGVYNEETHPEYTITQSSISRVDQVTITDTSTGQVVSSTQNWTTLTYDQISFIEIDAGASGNTVDVNGTATNTQTLIKSFDGSDIDTITVGDGTHNLDNISGLTIVGNGKSILAVDDRGNRVSPASVAGYNPIITQFLVDSQRLTRSVTALAELSALLPPTPIVLSQTVRYDNLASLAIFSGLAGQFTFQVDDTMGTDALVINADGSDAITVGDASHILNNITNLTINGNGRTTVTVDNRGDAAFSPPYSSFTPVLTQFVVTSQQLTISGMALAQIPGLSMSQVSFANAIHYQKLSGLTLFGGPSGLTNYQMDSTSGTGAITINAGGLDVVAVGDSDNNLDQVTSLTVNGNGNTALIVDDRGNATVPSGLAGYQPLTTQVSLVSQKLIRVTSASVAGNGSSFKTDVQFGGLASLTVDGGSGGSFAYQISNTIGADAVTLNALGASVVTVGDPQHNLDNVTGLTVNGNGSTSLTVDDRGNQVVPSGYTSYTPLVTQCFIESQQVVRLAQAVALPSPLPEPILWEEAIQYSDLADLKIQGGAGANVFNMQSSAANTATTLIGGTGGNNFIIAGAGNSLDQIQGPVSVAGSRGANGVMINDQGTAAVQDYQIFTTQFTRTPTADAGSSPSTTVSFTGIQSLALHVGTGHEDVVGVSGILSGTSVDLYGNSDYTFFAVGSAADTLDTIHGRLAIHGGANALYNAVEFIDTLNTVGHNYTLTAGRLQRDDMTPITWDGLQEVVLATGDNPYSGPSPDTVSVQSTAANVVTVVSEGSGDTTTLGLPTFGGKHTLQSLLGPVGVQSAYIPGETPALLIDDSGNPNVAARQVTFTAGGDVSTVINGLSPAPIYVTFNVGGTVNLLGNGGNETFLIQDPPTFSMAINGKGGTNTLDYSGYTGDVVVDLALGLASGLNLGIQNIQNVTGSIGNSLLVGAAGPNVLIGGTGRNIIIGGAGADQITGNAGDNILIGGTTSYDQNLAALELIMQEWLLISSFDARKAAIQDGLDLLAGTEFQLNATTVFPDRAANVLTPGLGDNWVF